MQTNNKNKPLEQSIINYCTTEEETNFNNEVNKVKELQNNQHKVLILDFSQTIMKDTKGRYLQKYKIEDKLITDDQVDQFIKEVGVKNIDGLLEVIKYAHENGFVITIASDTCCNLMRKVIDKIFPQYTQHIIIYSTNNGIRLDSKKNQ